MSYFYSRVMLKAYHLENGEFKKYQSIYSDRKASMRHMSDSAIHFHYTINNNGKKQHRNDSSDEPVILSTRNSRNSQDLAKNWRREYRLIKTLGIVMAVFCGCWIFFFLRYTLYDFCPEWIKKSLVLEDILFWIGYFNSALNPFLYNYTNRDFRRAFKSLLRLRRGGPNDSNSAGLCCCCCLNESRSNRLPSLTSSQPASRKATQILDENKGLIKLTSSNVI